MKSLICVLFLTTISLTVSFNAKSQSPTEHKPPSWVGIPIGSAKEAASPELMTEYADIVSKYGDTSKQWWAKFEKNISTKDRNRLEQIFKQMSADQQARQKVAFVKPAQALRKIIPSDKEFNTWKNENIYGVWINGKKIQNSMLNKSTNTDFEQVTVSRLYGTAKKNKKYSYQVNLMTKEYYRKYYEQTITRTGNIMVFRHSR